MNELFSQPIFLFSGCLFLLFLLSIMLLNNQKKRRKNPFDGKQKLPYFRRQLMTPVEQSAYQTLIHALPEYCVFPQVQASRVLDTPRNKDNYYWFNFISRLSYDFVICRPDSTPIAIIEIDDSSHQLNTRQSTDNRKNKATQAAGIAVIRYPANKLPQTAEIKRLIHNINKKAA